MAEYDVSRRELGGNFDVRYGEVAPDIHGAIQVPQRHTQALAYDGAGNLEYEGRAAFGSAKASAVWQIKKFVYTASNLTDILWADGNTDFDNVWNNRAALSYS